MVGRPSSGRSQTKVRAARTVYVRRAQTAAGDEPEALISGASPKKKVLLARRLGAGETIDLVDTPAKISAPDPYEEALRTVPQSFLSPTKGPRTDPETGSTVEHTVLGSAAEFDRLQASRQQGLDTSADFEEELSAAEGESLLSEYREKQEVAREKEAELQMLKNSQVQDHNARAVSKRKGLIHEEMAKGKQERALAKWDRQQNEWETFKVKMADRLGSSLDELVFSRAEEYREMLEDFQLLQKAVPVKEQHGSEGIWEMSLRDAWTKYVPVGNSLSGLFCPVSMKTDDQIGNFAKVRNPGGVQMRVDATKARTARGKVYNADTKSWRHSEPYQMRLRKFKKQMSELWPHEPIFEELEVTGYRPGTAGRTTATQFQATGSDVAGSDGGEYDAFVQGQAAAAVVPAAPAGPKLDFEATRVLLECTCGKVASSTVTARNSGSTALYYTWRKLEKPNVLKKKVDGVQRFFFAGKPGMVLPGNTVTFDFNFLSENAGAYTEEWELTTQPPLEGKGVSVSVKGISLSHVENTLQKENLESKLTASMQMSTVAAMLGDLVPGLDLTQVPDAVSAVTNPQPNVPEPQLSASSGKTDVTEELFNAQNRALHLFYSADVFPSFMALAAKTFDLLQFPQADREWDLSAESLFGLINHVVANADRQRCLDTLAVLVRIATTPPSDDALRYAIGHTLLGDWAQSSDKAGGRTKAEMIEAGTLPPDAEPLEDGSKAPRAASDEQQVQYTSAVEAEVTALLGESIDQFELLCQAGEAESRLMALQHFGLLPREPYDDAQDDDDADDSVMYDANGNPVPPLGTSEQLEQISMSMSSLNASANMTGSQLYSSLVDGGGHSERILRELSQSQDQPQ